MSKKRWIKGSELQGNVWAFASINDAWAVYQAALAKPGFISDKHDSSLDTGFFASRPVLIFLWGPRMDADLVASVHRLAVIAGGNEREEDLKQERLRWRALRSKRPSDVETIEKCLVAQVEMAAERPRAGAVSVADRRNPAASAAS